MKKSISLLAIMCITIIAHSSTDPITPIQNILVLQGQITSDQKTNIIVYQLNKIDNTWIEVENLNERIDYMLTLNPQESYQIWFMQKEGYLKILYVDPGEKGIWNVILDINFNDTNKLFAHLYQTCEVDENNINYQRDIIKKKATQNIPATTNINYTQKEE